MNQLPDFLIIGQEDWDEVWRRNQFLMTGLAQRFPNTKFLFVEMPFDLTYGLRSGQIFDKTSLVRKKFSLLRSGLQRLTEFPNIYTLVTPKLLPDGWQGGLWVNTQLQSKVIIQAMQQLNIHKPVFWTQNPFASSFLGAFAERIVIYDVTDDWTALSNASEHFLKRVGASDKVLTEKADFVIVCSQYLDSLKKKGRPDTVLIPNGVEVAHYAHIGEAEFPVAFEIAKLKPPVLGYTGSLHEARLDLNLICKLARERPDFNLVFIGPSFLSATARKELQSFSNIHLIGPVPYSQLPGYMQGFNAFIIPHMISDFTESLNPLKLFEYLAAGLPIISTNVAGVRDYANLVSIAHSHSEFVAAVLNVVSHPEKYDRVKARQLAQAANWDLRIEALLETIKSAL